MNLRTNTLFSLMGSVVPALAALAFVPATLARLGNDAFGVLTLLLALIGYFSIFDFGMGRGLTFRMSQLQATHGEHGSATYRQEASAVLATGLLITLLTGVLGALVIQSLAPVIINRGFNVPAQHLADALQSLHWVALGTMFVTINSATRGTLEGINRFKIPNINKAITGAGTFYVPYAVTATGSTTPLSDIASLLVGLRLAVCLLELAQVVQVSRVQWTAFRPSLHHAKQLLSYGGWILVSNLLSPLMVYGDRFVIGAVLGASQLPYYAIPQEGLQRFLILPTALCTALLPRLTQSTPSEFARLMNKSNRINNLSMFALCLAIGLAVYPFLRWWIGPEFADKAVAPCLVILAGMFVNANAMVKFVALHALGKTKETAILHACEFVFYFILLYLLTQQMGILGAAIAWTARVSIDNLALRRLLRTHLPGASRVA